MNPQELSLRKPALIALQGLFISGVAAALVLLFTSSGAPLSLLRERVRWPFVPLLALPVLLSWSCNGLRFYLMCRCLGRPLSFRRTVSIAISSEFGIAASPGGVGGTAIRLSFLKKSGLPYAHGGALLAADVCIDLLFFVLITPFTLWALFHYLDLESLCFAGGIHPWTWLLVPLCTGLYFRRKALFRLIRATPLFSTCRMAARIRLARKNLLHGFRQGRVAIALIFKHHRLPLVLNLLLTALQFASRYSVLPLAIWMLGIPVNPLPLIIIQGALFMISLAVVVPGGGGSVELLAAAALSPFVPAQLTGVAILLWRLFTYHFYLLFGGGVFVLTSRKLMRT
jgi:uncharacterized protein (TIRG00374 family)